MKKCCISSKIKSKFIQFIVCACVLSCLLKFSFGERVKDESNPICAAEGKGKLRFLSENPIWNLLEKVGGGAGGAGDAAGANPILNLVRQEEGWRRISVENPILMQHQALPVGMKRFETDSCTFAQYQKTLQPWFFIFFKFLCIIRSICMCRFWLPKS